MSGKKIMEENISAGGFFGTEKIGKILMKIAPPVMLAQLIQALYNIVDSFFVGKYSDEALTALTVIYPLQLIIIALAVGTGVGVNTYMARKFAQGNPDDAYNAAGTGTVLAFAMWALFAVASVLIMRPYVMTSAKSAQAIADAVTYGNIVCVGSLGSFLEGTWTKVHQSKGNMRLPMIAQVVGALTNINIRLGTYSSDGCCRSCVCYCMRTGCRGGDYGSERLSQTSAIKENAVLY